MSAIKLESYPNNEIRLTFLPLYSGKRALRKQSEGFFLEDEVDMSSSSSIDAAMGPDGDSQVILTPTCEENAENPYLDITDKLETSLKKPGYGGDPRPTVFGAAGRRKLIRAGAALTKSIKAPNEVVFLTGTLPGSTIESFRAIAQYSSFAVHRLKAWIAKRCPSKLDMYCWEWQKRGALHLHYAVHIEDEGIRSEVIRNFKSQWIRIIDAITIESGVDLWKKRNGYTHATNKDVIQADARECTKDIGRYLSKYISKKSSKKSNREFNPTRWWGISRPLNELLKNLSEVVMTTFSSERRYRAVQEDLSHFVDSQEVIVQSYKVEQFAEVLVLYCKPEEHEGILECMMKNLAKLRPVRRDLSTGGMPPATVQSDTAELMGVAQSLYAQILKLQWLQTYLDELLQPEHCAALLSDVRSESLTPRNCLVTWSRLTCVLEIPGARERLPIEVKKKFRRMDAIAGRLLAAWPRGVRLPSSYGPESEEWPPRNAKC